MSALNLQKVLDGGGKDFRGWLRRGVYGSGAVVGAQLLSAFACTRWNEHRVFARISGDCCACGTLVTRGTSACHWLRREILMNQVSRLLQPGPDLPSDAYYCVLGSPNSGKTHIVRKACQEVGKGVIYVQVTVPDMFGSELASALDFQGDFLNVMNMVQNSVLKAVFGGGRGDDSKDETDKALDALVKGARTYQRKHRKPVILVLDDVDRLAEKQAGLLEELQGHAKAWSNQGLLRVVFVLSDGPALSQLKRRSGWSRANISGFVTVRDVSREEALSYLRSRGVSEKDAADIYQTVGGRVGVLSHVATSVADMGISTADALDSVMDAAADECKVAGLLDEGPRRDSGLAAIQALLEAGGAEDDWAGISKARWSRLVPQPDNQKALLRSRVFVTHYPQQEILFGSRPTALYARQLLREARRGHTAPTAAAAAADGKSPDAPASRQSPPRQRGAGADSGGAPGGSGGAPEGDPDGLCGGGSSDGSEGGCEDGSSRSGAGGSGGSRGGGSMQRRQEGGGKDAVHEVTGRQLQNGGGGRGPSRQKARVRRTKDPSEL